VFWLFIWWQAAYYGWFGMSAFLQRRRQQEADIIFIAAAFLRLVIIDGRNSIPIVVMLISLCSSLAGYRERQPHKNDYILIKIQTQAGRKIFSMRDLMKLNFIKAKINASYRTIKLNLL